MIGSGWFFLWQRLRWRPTWHQHRNCLLSLSWSPCTYRNHHSDYDLQLTPLCRGTQGLLGRHVFGGTQVHPHFNSSVDLFPSFWHTSIDLALFKKKHVPDPRCVWENIPTQHIQTTSKKKHPNICANHPKIHMKNLPRCRSPQKWPQVFTTANTKDTKANCRKAVATG